MSNREERFARLYEWQMKNIDQRKPSEIMTLWAICLHARNGSGKAWPSMRTLCDLTGCDPRAVGRAKRALSKRGLVRVAWNENRTGHVIWVARSAPGKFDADALNAPSVYGTNEMHGRSPLGQPRGPARFIRVLPHKSSGGHP